MARTVARGERARPAANVQWVTPVAQDVAAADGPWHPAPVSADDLSTYYLEIGVDVLWPIIHGMPSAVDRRGAVDWEPALHVSRAIADAGRALAPRGGTLLDGRDISLVRDDASATRDALYESSGRVLRQVLSEDCTGPYGYFEHDD